MQIEMSEYFQGTGVSAVLVRKGTTVEVLTPGEVYECSGELAQYILSNRKGVEHKGKVKVEPDPEPVAAPVEDKPAGEESPVPSETEVMTSSPSKKKGGK